VYYLVTPGHYTRELQISITWSHLVTPFLFCRRQRNASQVCAVGFEPNPSHEPVLRALQTHFSKCGFKTHFFTSTAASDEEKADAAFFTDGQGQYLESGGTVVADNLNVYEKVEGQVSEFYLVTAGHTYFAGKNDSLVFFHFGSSGHEKI